MHPLILSSYSITSPPLPRTPERSEKCPRPRSYAGMVARSSSRAKKGSSRQRRRSRHFSQEIDPLKLSDNLNQNATASQGPSSPEGAPSTPESAMPGEHSPQLNNNMAIVDSHLPARSPVCIIEENPQHASLAPKTSPTYERACPTVSADELATSPEAVTGLSGSFILGSSPEADIQRQGFDQACPPAACTHPVSTADPTDSIPKASGHTHESQQNSLGIPDQPALATLAYCHSSHDSTIKLPSITSSQTKYTTVSKEVKELYLEGYAIPIMSGILQACVKYYEKTADFQDGDCLVTKVLKGMGAIMKPPADVTVYIDAVGRDRIKRELKKEQAGLESLQVINLWKETFRHDYVVKLAEANIRAWFRDNARSPTNASQAEAEAIKELVDVVSKGRSSENYRKHHRFWKFLHDIRVEGISTEMEDAEARRSNTRFRNNGKDHAFDI